MLSFAQYYGYNRHSQNSEDGIVQECVKRIGLATGHAVEIGGNDGHWMSNTRLLIEQGWSGLFVEYQYDLYLKCKANWANNPRVRSQCSRVDEKNINAFVDDSCDLVSLDTDGSDFSIFKGMKARPKIVIVEIDSSIPPYVLGAEGFNSDGAAGYAEMVMLGYSKGYFLLCHTGNLVFIDQQFQNLFPEVNGDPLTDAMTLYFNRSWLKEEAA